MSSQNAAQPGVLSTFLLGAALNPTAQPLPAMLARTLLLLLSLVPLPSKKHLTIFYSTIWKFRAGLSPPGAAAASVTSLCNRSVWRPRQQAGAAGLASKRSNAALTLNFLTSAVFRHSLTTTQMYFIIFVLGEVLFCSVAARLLPLVVKPKPGSVRQRTKRTPAAILQNLQSGVARGFALGVLAQKWKHLVGMKQPLCAALLGQMCEQCEISGHRVMLPSSDSSLLRGKGV